MQPVHEHYQRQANGPAKFGVTLDSSPHTLQIHPTDSRSIRRSNLEGLPSCVLVSYSWWVTTRAQELKHT